MNTIIQTMLKRKSCRNFANKKISKRKSSIIQKAIVSSPSAGNLKAFFPIPINRDFDKQEIAKICLGQEWMSNSYCLLVFVADPSKNIEPYQNRSGLYSIQDATIACSFAMIAAESLGIRSCWVGAFDESKLKQYLKLKKHEKPVAILVLGYYGL